MTTLKPTGITDREPDGRMHPYHDPDTEPCQGHVPFWRVTADDLAARDEAVRREVVERILAETATSRYSDPLAQGVVNRFLAAIRRAGARS